MSGKQGRAFWELEIYQRYEQLSEVLWGAVESWKPFHRDTIGAQMLDAVDSIGANIAEAVGRARLKESLHHLSYSRGSLTETQHWVRVAVRRKLFSTEQIGGLRETSTVLHKQLNAFIRAQHALPQASAQASGANCAQDPPAAYGEDGAKLGSPLEAPSPKPRAKSQELRARSQEPRAKSQEPRANSQEPRAKSQQPAAGGRHD